MPYCVCQVHFLLLRAFLVLSGRCLLVYTISTQVLTDFLEVLDQKLLIYLMKVCNKHGIKLHGAKLAKR